MRFLSAFAWSIIKEKQIHTLEIAYHLCCWRLHSTIKEVVSRNYKEFFLCFYFCFFFSLTANFPQLWTTVLFYDVSRPNIVFYRSKHWRHKWKPYSLIFKIAFGNLLRHADMPWSQREHYILCDVFYSAFNGMK